MKIKAGFTAWQLLELANNAVSGAAEPLTIRR